MNKAFCVIKIIYACNGRRLFFSGENDIYNLYSLSTAHEKKTRNSFFTTSTAFYVVTSTTCFQKFASKSVNLKSVPEMSFKNCLKRISGTDFIKKLKVEPREPVGTSKIIVHFNDIIYHII